MSNGLSSTDFLEYLQEAIVWSKRHRAGKADTMQYLADQLLKNHQPVAVALVELFAACNRHDAEAATIELSKVRRKIGGGDDATY